MIRRFVFSTAAVLAALGAPLSAGAEEPARAPIESAPFAPGDAVVMTLGGAAGKVASGVDLTILHIDKGPHGFELDLDGVVKTSITCTDRDLGLVAAFPGARTFRARITRGTITRTIAGIKRDLILPDFDTLHAGVREAITFRVVRGLERADAFSVVIEHDDQRIVLTPEGGSSPATLPSTLTVSSSGLDGFTLAGSRFASTPSPQLAASTARR
jgi:hypothetical protein